MKKKFLIIISSILAIVVAAIILVIINNTFEPEREKQKDDTVYKEPIIKQLKLKSISTKDKKVVIDNTTAYFTPDNGISQVNLKINSKNTLDELYLLIEFELDNKIESKVIYQQYVESNKKFEYMIQSIEDLTKTKSWKVSQINETEAIAKGFIKIEE